nr:hypothetical protein [Tanacetum cinerariifolium]
GVFKSLLGEILGEMMGKREERQLVMVDGPFGSQLEERVVYMEVMLDEGC